MKAGLFISFLICAAINVVAGQGICKSFEYRQEQLQKNPLLASSVSSLENFTKQFTGTTIAARLDRNIIRIPVVVHILYHSPSEKISDELVQSQLDILNACFRKQNADTVNIPAAFKSLAADCEIEFHLATSDSKQTSTSGIIKKYTPVTKWTTDDKVKFTSEMGDDAWDPKSYLNIWVCNMEKFAGYSSIAGGPENVDGVVLGFAAFGAQNKTAVHELGHWLNLKHIWGDENCGDDGVSDTPKQASYTSGCPTTIRITCGNGPNGDMYNNYMDFTSDQCINMFTKGQKARMQALFNPGGSRYSLLFSNGLNPPLIFETPVPEEDPKWLEPKIYPNPATSEINVDLSYDQRWFGKLLQISNLQGNVMMQVLITSNQQKINVSKLPAGLYFIAAKREDGVSIKQKFIKL